MYGGNIIMKVSIFNIIKGLKHFFWAHILKISQIYTHDGAQDLSNWIYSGFIGYKF